MSCQLPGCRRIGRIRITGEDALPVGIGGRSPLNYAAGQPDISKGLYFCLFNNIWGTNFTMRFEGSITYRFTIELDPDRVGDRAGMGS